MKKNNYIKISLKYITNFNPNFLIKPKNLNKNYTNNSDKINCKNFILFILLVKHVFTKSKVSIFIKPKKSNVFNILRAPYKNKMARHQLMFSRFFFNISFKLHLNNFIYFNNPSNIFIFVNFLKNFYSFFESNICFQHKSNINFKFKLNNFFFV